ncbi:MAG: metallophosphoesterase, partial [Candidatus Micrarchaeaceae archaeon]
MERIRFLYNEPAAIISALKKRYLVVGDMHIGLEREFSKRGIHVPNSAELMAGRIKRIMSENSLSRIIILGDIKNSILFPDAYDARSIKSFFSELSGFGLTVVAGNHDAHLAEIVDVPIEREFMLGDFAFVHGDKRPSSMESEYVISAHNHVAVRMKDRNGRYYDEKGWLIANISKAKAREFYDKCNDKARLVVMPA